LPRLGVAMCVWVGRVHHPWVGGGPSRRDDTAGGRKHENVAIGGTNISKCSTAFTITHATTPTHPLWSPPLDCGCVMYAQWHPRVCVVRRLDNHGHTNVTHKTALGGHQDSTSVAGPRSITPVITANGSSQAVPWYLYEGGVHSWCGQGGCVVSFTQCRPLCLADNSNESRARRPST
jgi:hypothetical protein